MFPIKTTALEQKLSLTKAGVTGELRAAPCREGAASHGSHTKERLFSLTSALRENSLEISPDTPKREFSEPGEPGTTLCNSSLFQCSATALHPDISDQGTKLFVRNRQLWMDCGAQIHCQASPIHKNAPRITTCPAEAQRGHSNSANHKRAAKGRAKLGRGEEKTSRTSSGINLFSKHTYKRYPLKYLMSSGSTEICKISSEKVFLLLLSEHHDKESEQNSNNHGEISTPGHLGNPNWTILSAAAHQQQ